MQPPKKGYFQAGVPMQSMSGRDPVAQAAGNLGKAVKQTGDLALALKEEQERQYMADAELILRRESAKITRDISLNKDPSEHFELARERYNSVTAGILKHEKFSPAFQKELAERIELFTSAKLEKIATDAKLIQVENGKKLHYARLDADKADGNYQGYFDKVQDGVGVYYPPETAEILRMKGERAQRNDFYQSQMEAGNKDFFEDEDLPLSDGDRRRYIEGAEAQQSNFEKEEANTINGEIALGTIRTRDELESRLERSSALTEETKVKFLKSWDKATPLSFEEKQAYLNTLNQAYNLFRDGKITKDQYAKIHHDTASGIYAMTTRPGTGALRQRAYALDPAKWADGIPASAKAEEKDIKIESMVSDFVRFGGLGSVPGKGDATPSERFDQSIELDIAEDMLMQSMKDWLSSPAGKDATDNEIREQIKREAASLSVSRSISNEYGSLEDDYRDILAPGTILPKQR